MRAVAVLLIGHADPDAVAREPPETRTSIIE